MSSPRVFTVYVDEALLKESLKVYPAYKGDLSLTDVTSLVVMRMYGVGRIFSHDHDFEGLKGIKRNESLRPGNYLREAMEFIAGSCYVFPRLSRPPRPTLHQAKKTEHSLTDSPQPSCESVVG